MTTQNLDLHQDPKLSPWGLHWFRRDLRICGNSALKSNWKKLGGHTLGFFCFDSKFLARADFSHNRFAFFIESLITLRHELKSQGGDLLVMDGSPREAFERLFHWLNQSQQHLPTLISWNRDYEPFARSRDHMMESFLKTTYGIDTFTARDHVILEPDEVCKDSGPYSVYTPYYNRWRKILTESQKLDRIQSQHPLDHYYEDFKDRLDPFASTNQKRLFRVNWSQLLSSTRIQTDQILEDFRTKNRSHVTILIPQAGSLAAFRTLESFQNRLPRYGSQRNVPFQTGTSKLSIYFKNGSLSTAQAVYYYKLLETQSSEHESFLKEIVWREFYYAIMFHHPDLETQPFNKKYINLQWRRDPSLFHRWCEGTTGVPIVDAGMRQLKQTGWMHNRVRMIVASFLTKDLLLDWRWGEEYFMKYLLDGDLAANNGGWQWAASTGCDPQPYFRIFNPWLQANKFDPDGTYIKEFVPELKDAPPKILHDEKADRSQWNYPPPMVNHAQQRMAALELFTKITN